MGRLRGEHLVCINDAGWGKVMASEERDYAMRILFDIVVAAFGTGAWRKKIPSRCHDPTGCTILRTGSLYP